MLKIGSRLVGASSPAFIVGELSANHGGSLDRALRIVRQLAESGADALKLQTYTADTITFRSTSEEFTLKDSTWGSYGNLWQLYDSAHTPWEWHEALFSEARAYGLSAFSSPFDESSVDFLESLDCEAYKIASPEINHIPLLEKVAATRKPVILSTGVASLDDLTLAINTLRRGGCRQIGVLKCTTCYPAPHGDCNLLTIPDLSSRFDVVPGFSDHTDGFSAAIVAVGLGAKILEKHICSSHDDAQTVDSFFSLDGVQFKNFVAQIREAESALGRVSYEVAPSAAKGRSGMRSLYVVKNIPKNGILSEKNIRCIRPANGLHPKHFRAVIGRKARRYLAAGEPLKSDDIEPGLEEIDL